MTDTTKKLDQRRLARERAIQMLTSADLNPPSDPEAFIADYWEQYASLDPSDTGADERLRPRYRAFAEDCFRGVTAHRDELDARLQPLLEDWDLWHLGTVERAALRLGAWELLFTAVPRPVAISEAIDLANWFSSSRARRFINGVLDKLARQAAPAPAEPAPESAP